MDNSIKIENHRFLFFRVVTFFYLFLLVVFCITRFNLVMLLLQQPLHHQEGVNLIPFQSIIDGYKKYGKLSWDIFGNILMYIPLGVITCYYFKNTSFFLKSIFTFTVSCFVEIMQFILKTGSFDIDDIIVNTLGGLIGIFIYNAIYSLLKNNQVLTNDTINTITILCSPFLLIYISDFFSSTVFSINLFHILFLIVSFTIIHKTFMVDLSNKYLRFYYTLTVIFSLWFFYFFI